MVRGKAAKQRALHIYNRENWMERFGWTADRTQRSGRAMASNLFGTKYWFCGRCLFHTPGIGGLVWGWFKSTTFTVHLISNLMSRLVGQEVPGCRPELQPEAAATSAGWKGKGGDGLTEPRGPLLEGGITAGREMEPGRDATTAGD